jgi:hypothetical protein
VRSAGRKRAGAHALEEQPLLVAVHGRRLPVLLGPI